MDSRSILLALLPIGLTLISYAIIRDLLWGIFLGNKSKKAALRIKSEAKGMEKLTQSYMTPHIIKYQKDYKTWKLMRTLMLLFAFIQLAGFTVMVITRVPFWIVAIVCGVIVIFNIVLFGIMMSKTQSSDNKHDRKGSPWKYEQ